MLPLANNVDYIDCRHARACPIIRWGRSTGDFFPWGGSKHPSDTCSFLGLNRVDVTNGLSIRSSGAARGTVRHVCRHSCSRVPFSCQCRHSWCWSIAPTLCRIETDTRDGIFINTARIVRGAGSMKRSSVRPYVRLSVPSIDSSSDGWQVCC